MNQKHCASNRVAFRADSLSIALMLFYMIHYWCPNNFLLFYLEANSKERDGDSKLIK